MIASETANGLAPSPPLSAVLALLFLTSILNAEIRPHPVPLAANVESSKCLECHKDKVTGKYVHAAGSVACTTCHSATTVKGITYMTLSSDSTLLCFDCHTRSSDPVQHYAYREGNCTFCHSPHASDFPDQLHAAPQEVCMSCHVRGLMKVDKRGQYVTLPWGTGIPFKEMEEWTYLQLDKTHRFNHPVEGHPVSGPNTALGKGTPPITCLTCHEPHHSTVPNLLNPKYKTAVSLCVSCHSGDLH